MADGGVGVEGVGGRSQKEHQSQRTALFTPSPVPPGPGRGWRWGAVWLQNWGVRSWKVLGWPSPSGQIGAPASQGGRGPWVWPGSCRADSPPPPRVISEPSVPLKSSRYRSRRGGSLGSPISFQGRSWLGKFFTRPSPPFPAEPMRPGHPTGTHATAGRPGSVAPWKRWWRRPLGGNLRVQIVLPGLAPVAVGAGGGRACGDDRRQGGDEGQAEPRVATCAPAPGRVFLPLGL